MAYILFSHIQIFRDLKWGFIKDKSRDVSVWLTKKQSIFRSSPETSQVQDLWYYAIPHAVAVVLDASVQRSSKL